VRPGERGRRCVAGIALGLLASAGAAALAAPASAPSAAAPASPSDSAAEFAALRQDCIAAAAAVQQREPAIAVLEHDTELLGRDAAGRQRGLNESRVEQARLLGEIERFARHPPERFALAMETPIDRIRSELLLDAIVPALRTEARALSAEIERIAALRSEIAAKEGELAAANDALGQDRERLRQLTARRLELGRRLVPPDAGVAARIARLGHDAKDPADLIKRADAESDRRDKELLARARAALPKAKASALTPEVADPTRPHEVRAFDPPHSALVMPVSGTITQPFGAADAPGTTGQGLGLAASPGGAIVAPFDGRVVYAGKFGNLGLVLIIRHAGLYHTLLAGLGRVDIGVDDWVVAGEPVGVMPDASGAALDFELRRDGRPVDPQPWLAARDDEHSGQAGDQRMRE
jgi:murein hydrolase activator